MAPAAEILAVSVGNTRTRVDHLQGFCAGTAKWATAICLAIPVSILYP